MIKTWDSELPETADPNKYHGQAILVAGKSRIRLEPRISVDNTLPILDAFVDDGRWIVECQSEHPDGTQCMGASLAREDGLFMCWSCWNHSHGHQYRRTKFPKDRKAIEKRLLKEPHSNRNWKPRQRIRKSGRS